MIVKDLELNVDYKRAGIDKRTPNPKLTAYILSPSAAVPSCKRKAVIICPGGGYSHCSGREGEPVALKFSAMGCQVFLLNYSVAPERYPAALLELAKSVAVVRDHAAEWGIDADKIAVLGFSAGGHLACSLGTFWHKDFINLALETKKEQIKPNGMLLCYPVITSGEYAHKGSFENLLGDRAYEETVREQVSLEEQVDEQFPKTFLWHTVTDEAVPVENSLLLAGAFRKHRISFEMHLFPNGRHGLSLADEETTKEGQKIETECQSWISLAAAWMKNL